MTDDALLLEVLGQSQRFGALGESPETAIAHSERFLAALGAASSVLDLGSGGGVPGLTVAWRRPDLRLTLMDRRTARTDLLERLVRKLGVSERVSVAAGDATVLGLEARFSSTFDTVICRSFGTPEVTARTAGLFLQSGGILVVAEPPTGSTRWDSDEISRLGYSPVPSPVYLQILRFQPQ